MEFSATTEIDAPPDRVWPVLSDVESWPGWTPTMTSVKRLDDGPLRVGSRADVRQPKLRPASYLVTVVDEGLEFTWVTRSAGVTGTAEHVLEQLPDGRTRVTLGVSFSGLLAGAVKLAMGRLTQQYVETEARELKRAVEAAG